MKNRKYCSLSPFPKKTTVGSHSRFLSAMALAATFVLTMTSCSSIGRKGSSHMGKDISQIKKANYKAEISCHDPEIILADDGKYYMTGSHQVIAKSEDLAKWDYVANGNRMFDNIFDGDMPAFSYVGKNEDNGYSIWASNIYYNKTMGKYLMYFCTTSSYIKSNLTLAVSDTPGGPYSYKETFLYSGFGKNDLDQTNLKETLGDTDLSRYFKYGAYDNKKWPNCIDPAVFEDKDGNMWLVYGSWSGGIFTLPLDPQTGLPIHKAVEDSAGSADMDPYYGYRIAGGGHHAVEGPYIQYDPKTEKYFLFVSYGKLTREGGYQIREFRGDYPWGPFQDSSGKVLGDQEDYFDYGLKLMGNYSFPSLETTYMAPGGQSVFLDKEGNMNLVYHQRFDNGSEYHEPRVHKLQLTEDGWYLPEAFERLPEKENGNGGAEQKAGKSEAGENHSLFDSDKIQGTYYILRHGTDVSAKIHEAEEYRLQGGKILTKDGKKVASYNVKNNSDKIEIRYKGILYQGTILETKDEAGNPVREILAAGKDNQTLWAVMYLEK